MKVLIEQMLRCYSGLKMKLLHISNGGFIVRNLLRSQIDYFLSQNIAVECICSPDTDVEALQRRGYVVHPIPIAREFSPGKNLVTIARLCQFLRRHANIQQGDTLVHVHTPIAALLGRVAARLAGVKRVVYTAHGFPFHDQSPWWLYWLYFHIEKFAAAMTDLILTQSYEDFEMAQTSGLCTPQKLRYLGNGVDIQKFNRDRLPPETQSQLRQSLGIPPQAGPIIGMIGRLTYKKGSGVLIDAIAQLLPEFPNLHVVIVGGEVLSDPEPFQTTLLQRISALQLEHHVTLTGYRQDTPQLLALLDIFTLPTFTHEGLPRAILEAMAMALPVVTTNIRGCREAVLHEQTGLIVPPRQSDALAAALKRLLLDADLRTSYGQAGRCRVEAEYDERLVFQRLVACYQEIGLSPTALYPSPNHDSFSPSAYSAVPHYEV